MNPAEFSSRNHPARARFTWMTPRAPSWLALAMAAGACCALSCHRASPSAIILVIDTNLPIPADMDRVDISISGPTQANEVVTLNLADAREPPFPRTLRLVSGGGPLGPVMVSVAGFQGAGNRIIQQDARTEFVEGQTRMLAMDLLSSCTIPAANCLATETCGAPGCIPVARAGLQLPVWTGELPGLPDIPDGASPPPMAIQNRTVWASSFASAGIEGRTLWAWGRNYDGQLGIGNTLNQKTRRAVMKVQGPASVGLGTSHSCICDQSGQAWCWGLNDSGQLGMGNMGSARLTVPTMVPGFTDCEQIAGGASHTCAVRIDKTVACWGLNASGQAGQPGSDPITAPRAVPGLSNVAEVACGDAYTCARRTDLSVVCWGANRVGQLGDGTNTSRSSPAPVMGIQDAVELAVGRTVACVRHMAGGQISCWGENSDGVLGMTARSSSNVPVDVPNVTDTVQVTVGLQHACAIRATGVASCWGRNDFGQLGNDSPATSSVTPVDVLDILGVTSISSGSGHVCARHSLGVSCWGANDVNQLGDGTAMNRRRPISVAQF